MTVMLIGSCLWFAAVAASFTIVHLLLSNHND